MRRSACQTSLRRTSWISVYVDISTLPTRYVRINMGCPSCPSCTTAPFTRKLDHPTPPMHPNLRMLHSTNVPSGQNDLAGRCICCGERWCICLVVDGSFYPDSISGASGFNANSTTTYIAVRHTATSLFSLLFKFYLHAERYGICSGRICAPHAWRRCYQRNVYFGPYGRQRVAKYQRHRSDDNGVLLSIGFANRLLILWP